MNILDTLRNNVFLLGSTAGLALLAVWSIIPSSKVDPIAEKRILQFMTENSLELSKVESAKNTVIISDMPQTFIVSVEPGDTLADILQEKKIPKKQALLIIQALSKYVSPKKIRVNEKINLLVKGNSDGTSELLRLSLAKDKRSQVEVVRNKDGYYQAKLMEKELKQHTECVHVPIKGSLYADAQKKKIPYSVIRQLIAAYSYDVDFQRDIKSGDSFSVYYEASVDPETGQEHISNLLYANLKINGKNRPVYAYESESGVSFYYADGQSVKKQFMSTPINGARISSGYGLRMHPIHGYTKFHKGLDFAAPRGTPVIAAADGVVTKSCWYGTYGHYIEIQHSGGYSTAYAHLSGYAKHIRPGVRVSQGRTIGYVGSTGASTGPHLHFELKKNGSQINPRTKSLHNSTNRLSGNDLKKFQKIRQDVDGKVNASLNKIKL
jgi:murein DD-endopeptidase MepM/ murein hydrolase activator NlpD